MSDHHTLMYIPISMVPAVQSIMPRPNGEPASHVVVPRDGLVAMANSEPWTGRAPLAEAAKRMLAASEAGHD